MIIHTYIHTYIKIRVFLSTTIQVSRPKSEYMRCNFNGAARREGLLIYLENHKLSYIKYFTYFGFMIDVNGDIDEDDIHS